MSELNFTDLLPEHKEKIRALHFGMKSRKDIYAILKTQYKNNPSLNSVKRFILKENKSRHQIIVENFKDGVFDGSTPKEASELLKVDIRSIYRYLKESQKSTTNASTPIIISKGDE